MQIFDCLALNCPLFGPHLLEASAGTGKTFSIEHIFVRLILEKIELEQILVVTFTKAATRELKARIRSNIEKAIHSLKSDQSASQYLEPRRGSKESIQLLTDALSSFDQCQIFTIHGFCLRTLKEFAFEAHLSFPSNLDEKKSVPEVFKKAASDFLEYGIDPSWISNEQLTLLFKEFDSSDAIINRLLRFEEFTPSLSFSESFAKCKAALHLWSLEEEKLLEDFRAVQKNYKAGVKGDFEMQVKGLANLQFFPSLLKERGSLFDFLHPENRKVRVEEPVVCHYPGFFEWAQGVIAPLVRQKVFPLLQEAFERVIEKILREEPHFDPDQILKEMRKAIANDHFVQKVKQKYVAVIIDEFQDTDAIQWDIFQTLFAASSLKALYLVGDPKQSIYRFRSADIYTYLKARDYLGEENGYLLNTNFRSSKPLIGALNALFSREWFHLPKTGAILPYYPVEAGANISSDFGDSLGAIHFLIVEGASAFEELLIPYAAKEIERLNLKRCACLVKDRYQVAKMSDFLKERGIAVASKSEISLGKTASFQAICELLKAVISPHDPRAEAIFRAGPFARSDLYLPEMKRLLEERGLIPFAKEFPLDREAMQIFEFLFAWERQEGFSFEGLQRVLERLKNQEPDEGGRLRVEVDEEAVQIMTLHISKGLEFDVVFALGLATRTPEGEEADELDAEKMRQLYVAMTRAKKRLYVPIVLSQKEGRGGASPMELFSRYFERPFLDEIERLSKTESITFEQLKLPVPLSRVPTVRGIDVPKLREKEKVLFPRSFTPSVLSSFTTLSQTKEAVAHFQDGAKWIEPEENLFTMQTMPRGAQTGIVIHSIFESLFSAKGQIWKDPKAIDALVEEHLRFSQLMPWQKPIQEMVRETLRMPLASDHGWFSLSEIEKFQVEMEFVFSDPPHFVKGFIDLVFYHGGKVFFVDWKTNWLEKYDLPHLKKAMEEHDYPLQARLYSEAMRRHFKAQIGGAYYVFVRGNVFYPIPK